MNHLLTTVLLCCALGSCRSQRSAANSYPAQIGNIAYDPAQDQKDFPLCIADTLNQNFGSNGMRYEGEKPALAREFFSRYDATRVKKEDGLLRIRFIVNCNGATDRFRIMGMNNDYTEKRFDTTISNQLLRITRSLNGWKPIKGQRYNIGYYQYLIFKIKDGNLKEILP